MGLFRLPIELILRILEDLDYRSILTCKRVCRRINVLIDQSTALRYVVALAAAGQQDGSSGHLSTVERLQMLTGYRDAWRELKWTEHTCVPTQDGEAWELYGGVFAECSKDRKTLFFRKLPSRLRGIEAREWRVDVGFRVCDFTMDPSQDLLVALQVHSSTGKCEVHLQAMSSGNAHPAAYDSSVLEHTITDLEGEWGYDIVINGDRLGVMFTDTDRGADSEFVVWNWKSGKILMWLTGDDIRSFVFLDERFVMVARIIDRNSLADSPNLAVYDLDAMYPEQINIRDVPYRCAFTLPEMGPSTILQDLLIRSDPAPNWQPRRDLAVPFHAMHAERLFVITMFAFVISPRRNNLRALDLFVSSHFFLERARDPRADTLSWSQWGPHYSRAVVRSKPTQTDWVCYIFGMRFINPKPVGRHPDKKNRILDFHPARVDRVRRGELSEGWEVVTAETVISRDWLQSVPLKTNLPYLVKEISLPLRSATDSLISLMISEDTLIALEEPFFAPRKMHLWTF